jgi:hypothetical protein
MLRPPLGNGPCRRGSQATSRHSRPSIGRPSVEVSARPECARPATYLCLIIARRTDVAISSDAAGRRRGKLRRSNRRPRRTKGIFFSRWRRPLVAGLSSLAVVAAVAPSGVAAGVLQIGSDPYTQATCAGSTTTNHRTEVEPDTFSFGSTIVAAFLVTSTSAWRARCGTSTALWLPRLPGTSASCSRSPAPTSGRSAALILMGGLRR